MDDQTRRQLSRGHTIDITTIGRRTGEPRRIEIVFHNFDGRLYISGTPSDRKRAWLLNLEADPHFTFHLKGTHSADLAGVARAWRRDDLDDMVLRSPLIEVRLDELAA